MYVIVIEFLTTLYLPCTTKVKISILCEVGSNPLESAPMITIDGVDKVFHKMIISTRMYGIGLSKVSMKKLLQT